MPPDFQAMRSGFQARRAFEPIMEADFQVIGIGEKTMPVHVQSTASDLQTMRSSSQTRPAHSQTMATYSQAITPRCLSMRREAEAMPGGSEIMTTDRRGNGL